MYVVNEGELLKSIAELKRQARTLNLLFKHEEQNLPRDGSENVENHRNSNAHCQQDVQKTEVTPQTTQQPVPKRKTKHKGKRSH